MSTRLVCLLAVEWRGDGAAPENLERFSSLLRETVSPEHGKLLEHPVKQDPERRIFLFPGPSNGLRAALAVHRALSGSDFRAALGLHTGECLDREGQLLGAPLLEVAELAHQGRAGELAVTEVFHLTLPLESKQGWARQDRPRVLAGTPWTIFLHPGPEED